MTIRHLQTGMAPAPTGAGPTRRAVLAGAGAALSLSLAGARPARAATGSAGGPAGVVELFTSQGCSSCPRADAMLGRLAARDDVLALSWHVDYWNYLGWSDTFSDPLFSARQRAYARSFRRRGVYTPQAVVNGRMHEVGSREAIVHAVLADFAGTPRGLSVPLDCEGSGGGFDVRARAQGAATLYAVTFDPRRTVTIERGENAGRDMVYHNVVRSLAPVAMMKEGRLDATLPPEALSGGAVEPGARSALLLQRVGRDGALGPILGATVLPL